ncbi:MAG: DUF4468 domain-containing protein [Pseudomonadota bacterium]
MSKPTTFIAALGLLLLSGCAATGSNTPLVEYQEVMEFDSEIDKSTLFNRTRLWLAESFVDSKEVIELEDKEAGLLVGNGGMEYTYPLVPAMPGRFSLRIDIKDGKLRTTYNNFKIYHSGSQFSSGGWSAVREGTPNGYPEQSIKTAKRLNADLKEFVQQAGADNNW